MAFHHIDTWVFDLDNTLYNADTHSFPQMGRRMTSFVADRLKLPLAEADIVRRDYFKRYGTTLRGLMSEHAVPPEDFLHFVHDFDLSPIAPCDITRSTLQRLPGRKIVFTNAPRNFATRMLEHLGIAPVFDGVFAVEDADHWPKPLPATYDLFLKRHNVTASSACMIEDMEENLVPAHALGMTTVWLHTGTASLDHEIERPHIHHSATRLPEFFAHPFFAAPPGKTNP